MVDSMDMRLDIILQEIDDVVNFLKSNYPDKHINLVAVSYGAYRVVAYLQKYRPNVNKVVLINPAFKMIDILEKVKNFKYGELKPDDKIVVKSSKNKFISKRFLDDIYNCDI